jgi:hypothetical protein
MKAGFIKAVLAIALIAAAAAGILYGLKHIQTLKLRALEDGIAALESETVPLRFKILSRDGRGVSLRIRLYDLAGKEVGMTEATLPGRQAFFDFLTVSRDGAWLAFPYRLFSEELAPADGIDLSPLVAPAGLPLTYGGGSLNAEALEELGAIYGDLLSGKAPRSYFGNAVHDVAELGAFSLDAVYKVVVRKKGGIEIMEDDDAN